MLARTGRAVAQRELSLPPGASGSAGRGASYVVRRATPADVSGIAALFDLSFDTGGSGLAQRFKVEQIERFTRDMPGFVAVDVNNAVVGALVAQRLPEGTEAGPVTSAMLRAYTPPPDSYVYGPIAVSAGFRRGGVADALAAGLLASLPDRVGLLFIDQRNSASLRAHGSRWFRRLGSFECAGHSFDCLSFSAHYGSQEFAVKKNL